MRAKQLLKLLSRVAGNFWREVTRPAWLTVWEQFAAETRGQLEEPLLGPRRICVPYRGFSIEFSNIHHHSREWTRVLTRVACDLDIEFAIQKADVLSKLSHAIGLPGVTTGYRELDEGFSVSGNCDSHLARLLGAAAMRESIARQTDAQLSFRPVLRHESFRLTGRTLSGTSLLQSDTQKIVVDLPRLKSLLELQQRMLDGLLDAGIARPLSEAAVPRK